MAGSPVRRARREAGIVARGNGAGYGGPAKGSWDQFKAGNEAARTHGATLERYWGPVAQTLRDELFALPSCPSYLRDPMWGFALRGWAEAEAQCLLGREYLEGLTVEQRFNARKQGQAAPIEIVQKLEKHAANMRDKVGLNPAAAARLGKMLKSTELDIATLAAQFMAGEFGDGEDGE